MKEKIIIFIIGLLLGAIISTGSIYFYSVATGSNNSDMQIQNDNNNLQEMQNSDSQTPPDKPDENNTENSNNQ